MARTQDHKHLIPLLTEAVRQAQGTNSALIMEHDVVKGRHGIGGQYWSGDAKDHSIWLRWNQPCQGGEMRKYESVHGGECTQPASSRPGDLYHPFPEGNPVAVGVRLTQGPIHENAIPILKFLFTDPSSPYRTGHGDTTFSTDAHGKICGVIIEGTKKVDPTALVNLLQMIRSQVIPCHNRITMYINEGATMLQALALAFLQSQYPYYFAMVMDVRKFMDGEPNDLSHGISFYDRGDYNRINVHDLFTCPDRVNGAIWARDFQNRPTTADKIEVLMKKYKDTGGTKLLPVSVPTPVVDAIEVKPKRMHTRKAA